ncbi:MAG: alpha-L-fucosidase [Coraliomargaritaceae bacterium]
MYPISFTNRLPLKRSRFLWLLVSFSLPFSTPAAVPGQTEDGSAANYTEKANEDGYVPRIEVRDGKKYYYWPQWNQWKNGKLHVEKERTTHPDAQWWPEAGLGLFMHWGIVSEFGPTGEAWCGRWSPQRAETGAFHPQQEIWDAAESFNPKQYDPHKWMAAAKKAGFQYAVLTAKHHDGYALWDSDHALIGVRQYLDGRDLVQPYVDACREHGLKVGFYYSGMDWYFIREYMNFSITKDRIVNYKGEFVDRLPSEPPSLRKAYQEFNEAQVHELVKFKPDIWWGDAGHGMPMETIRELLPGVVCNNRDPGGGDHATPEGLGMAKPGYIKPILENGWWWEANSIITKGSWHYDQYKSEFVWPSDSILMELAKIRCMGGNFLANIGPRPDGQLQEEAYRLFADMAEWMETNKESVFGINGGGPWPEKCNVPITAKDRNWYFHSKKDQATQEKPVVLSDCPAKPLSVVLLRTGDAISYIYEEGELRFAVPENRKAGHVTDVVKVEFGEDFDPNPFLFRHW